MTFPGLRTVQYGMQKIAGGQHMPRHQHAASYVTVVVEGAYEQVGYAGRLRVREGDVLVQPTLDCHSDTMLSRGLVLMRLPWRHDPGWGGAWRGLDVDEIRRVGTRDPAAAGALVAAQLRGRAPMAPVAEHWVDDLAARLRADPCLRIAQWAESEGRSREAAARAFGARYGVAPARLRTELRARAAWLRIVGSREPLSAIAFDLGFADQSHMSRAVRWLTGASPGRWRAPPGNAGH
jgi:AraC-like DNA-binding protein